MRDRSTLIGVVDVPIFFDLILEYKVRLKIWFLLLHVFAESV